MTQHHLRSRVLSLSTLGHLEIRDAEGTQVRLRRKPLALLAYLARRAPRAIPRVGLADLLWGESGDDALARKSLRQALSELRDVVGDRLQADGATVQLVLEELEVDVLRLESDVIASQFESAVARWRGDFLAGLDEIGDESWRTWLESERAGVRQKVAISFDALVRDAESRADWTGVMRWSESWIEALPADERPCVHLAAALQARGRTVEAAARLEDCVRRLRFEYGIEPSASLVRLAAELEQAPPPPVPGGRALLSPDLVGRGDAMATLASAWKRAKAAEGRAIAIVADDGLGKTRLAHEFARYVIAQDDATRVVQVRVFPSEPHSNFAAVRDVLANLAQAPGLAAVPPRVLVGLAQITPEIRERFRHLPDDGAQDDHPDQFRRALADVAEEETLLVIVDDAADADAKSLECLAAIFRRPPSSMLLVCTGRPGAWLANAAAFDIYRDSPHIGRITLAPLTEDQSLEMLSTMVPLAQPGARDLASDLFRESSGNPAQLALLFGHLADRGVVAPDAQGVWSLTRALDAGDLSVPAVRDATRLRVEHLTPDARRIVESASVASRSDPGLLEALSGLDAESFQVALGELLVSRLLRESITAPGRYELASEVNRRAIYDLLAPSRRRELHGAAYRILRASAPDVSAEELARHRKGAEHESSPRRRRWVLAAAGLLLVAAGVTAYRRAKNARVAPGSPVILADVRNLTGDSILDHALHAAATVALQESRQVALLPRSRVRETLALMRRSADTVFDESLALDVARREGVTRVVAFTVARFDSAYLLTSRLIDPVSGRDVYTGRERTSGRSEIIAGLDRLVAELRRALGEADVQRVPTMSALPRVTTASLEALQAYARGADAWTRRDYDAAHDAFLRAVAMDSGFALAHASLADFYFSRMSDPVSGNAALDRALAHRDRLTEREQLALQIRIARYRGPAQEEARLAEAQARRYPSRDTWYSYGTTMMRLRRCDSAIPALRESLGFDSSFTNGYVNLATCHQFLGDYASAIREYEHAQRTDSTALLRGNLNYEWGHALFRLRGSAAADSVYRLMLRRPSPQDVAGGWRSLAFIAMYQGRYREAIRGLDSAVVYARLASVDLTEYRNLLLLAEAALTAGDRTRALAALERARVLEATVPMNSFFHLYGVHAHVRAGLLGAARQAQAKARSGSTSTLESDRNNFALIDALIRSAEGRHREALNALGSITDTTHVVWIQGLRASSYAALGLPDSALAALNRVANDLYFGFEPLDEWLRSLLRAARLAERTGDSAGARSAYETFVARWSHGDEDLPELREARDALQRLLPGDAPRRK